MREILADKFKALAEITVREFSDTADPEEVTREVRVWLAGLAKDHGEYLEVAAPDKIKTSGPSTEVAETKPERQRRTFPPPFSSN